MDTWKQAQVMKMKVGSQTDETAFIDPRFE
jgi:hypothetical protein